MKAIVISIRGLGLAVLVAAAPAAAQVILNASSWVPPGHPLTATMLAPFCADIEKATAARVKCNILPKAPVGAVQTFDGVKDGLMDLSFITHGYTPGRFALTDAPEFPFMGDTAEVTAVAYQRIYERMLAGANEHRDVVLLSVFTHGPGQMFRSKRAIGALRDLEGLKIRVGGGLVNEITKNLGAVPMLKPAPESYELLSTGVADGLFFPKESPLSFKLVPLIKHVTYVPGGLYNVSFAWIANQAKWNQIPEADRRPIQPLLGQPLDWFDRALVPLLGYVAATLMFCLMLLTCVDVVGRYFLNKPITGGFELTEVLLAALIFAGLPLVTLRGDHITVDLFDPVTPDWLFSIQHALASLIRAACTGCLAWRLWLRAADLQRRSEEH